MKKVFILNGIILTATSIIMRLVGMCFNIYISKKVGSESLGIFSLIMSVYMFSITLATSRNKSCSNKNYNGTNYFES